MTIVDTHSNVTNDNHNCYIQDIDYKEQDSFNQSYLSDRHKVILKVIGVNTSLTDPSKATPTTVPTTMR